MLILSGVEMKFPIFGMVLALMLGQYTVLDLSNRLAHNLAGTDQQDVEISLATVTTNASSNVFCRQPANATWQCPQS